MNNGKSKAYKNTLGQLHRLDGPALLQYNEAGQLMEEQWYSHGLLHRQNAPALIQYNAMGLRIREHWFSQGQYHNTHAPALLIYQGHRVIEEHWYTHDQLHRADGPALIKYTPHSQIILAAWYIHGSQVLGEKQQKAYQAMCHELANLTLIANINTSTNATITKKPRL